MYEWNSGQNFFSLFPYTTLFRSKKVDDISRKCENKILLPNSIHSRPGQENSEKIEKKLKQLKNLFLALFLAKKELDRPRNRNKI